MPQARKHRSTSAAATAAVVAFALFVSACGGGSDEKKAAPKRTTTTVAPTTTTVAPPTAPLTGLPDPGAVSHTRPALSVKVENTDAARPQTGIDVADVVYEEVVEGNITRFVAMFNSTVPGVVGPVRSVRAIDPDIVWPVGGIFAFSGGAPVNVDAINAAPVHPVDESSGALVRNEPNQPPRDAPHNLYGLGQPLFDAGGDPKPPGPLFQYIANGSPPLGPQGVIDFHVGFTPPYDVVWTWDGASGTWRRSIGGVPQTVVGGAPIAPTNVVIQFTPYTGEAEANLIGEGDVWVFTDGILRTGKWKRPDKGQPAKYVDGLGIPIPLRPGRTWVELLPTGSAVDVTQAPPPATTLPPPTTVPPTTTTKKKK